MKQIMDTQRKSFPGEREEQVSAKVQSALVASCSLGALKEQQRGQDG